MFITLNSEFYIVIPMTNCPKVCTMIFKKMVYLQSFTYHLSVISNILVTAR